MTLFGFNLHISRRAAAPAVEKSYPLTPEEWLRGEEAPRGPVLANAYEQVVWVYRAINVLAEQVANVPFLFSAGERGSENLITAGPLPEFYLRPHPHINQFQYWELRVIWLMLRGECVRVPLFQDAAAGPAGRRRLAGVLLLDPAQFDHIVEDGQLLGWRYRAPGSRAPLADQVFLPEEIWFEKLPNPFDFWRGLPPLRAAALAAQTDFAAGAFMKGLIENNGDAGTIVRSEKPLSDQQRAQLLGQLKNRKRRAGLADTPLVISGCTEIVQPRLSSGDLEFLENRKFSRGEICAAFGVPEEIVTTTDHAKYDVMAGARLNFIENRVAPLCRRLEAEEEQVVRALDPGASGWFDLDSLPILQQARRSRLEAARTGFEMGVPFNELNRVLDLGFRRLPWGDAGYVSGKLNEVGEMKAEGRNPRAERSPNSETRNSRFIGNPGSEIRSAGAAGSGGEAEGEASGGGADPLADDWAAAAEHALPLIPQVELLPGRAAQMLAVLADPGAAPPAADCAHAPAAPNFSLSSAEDAGQDSGVGAGESSGFGRSSTQRQFGAANVRLAQKFRRFLFEQRGRVLSVISSCRRADGACDETTVLQALPSPGPGPEYGHLQRLLKDLLSGRDIRERADDDRAALAEWLRALDDRLRALSDFHLFQVRHAVRESAQAGESREQLVARIKSIYNTAAKVHVSL